MTRRSHGSPLLAMRPALGVSLSPLNHGEHAPGQIPMHRAARQTARDIAPELMDLMTARPRPALMTMRYGHPVFTPGDVAKGLGLSATAEQRLGGLVRDAAETAANEAVFRKDMTARLCGQLQLDADQRRAVLQRSVMFWRTAADGNRLPMQAVRHAALSKAVVGYVEPDDTSQGIPTHKVRQRGRTDPVRQVTGESKRAIPPGSIRLHFSRARNGYVRAEKMPDGTWRVLGKLHPEHAKDASKDKTPTLDPKQEHPTSPPPGTERLHTKEGHPYRQHPITIGKAQPPDGKIPGGLADKKKPSDFDAGALADGVKIELEHTSSRPIAQEIAMDHLTEDPQYYEKLRRIEKSGAHTVITCAQQHENVYPAGERAGIWNRTRVRAEESKMDNNEPRNSNEDDVFKAIRAFQIPESLEKADGDGDGDGDGGGGGAGGAGDFSQAVDGMPNPGGEGGSEKKLSEDDVEVSKQLKPGDPKSKKLAQGSQGSGDGGGLGGATSGATSGASSMSKSDGPRRDPAALHSVQVPTARDGTWSQGPDARVLYSNVADQNIAKAMEDGTLSPETGSPRHSPLYGVNQCGQCGTGFAKAITVCPECGTDRIYGGGGGGPRVQMSKSVEDALTPPDVRDLHFSE